MQSLAKCLSDAFLRPYAPLSVVWCYRCTYNRCRASSLFPQDNAFVKSRFTRFISVTFWYVPNLVPLYYTFEYLCHWSLEYYIQIAYHILEASLCDVLSSILSCNVVNAFALIISYVSSTSLCKRHFPITSKSLKFCHCWRSSACTWVHCQISDLPWTGQAHQR